MDLSYWLCPNEEIRPSRLNLGRKSKTITNTKRLPRIASERAVRPTVALKARGLFSAAIKATFKATFSGDLSFDFATCAGSAHLASWLGGSFAAPLHNIYTTITPHIAQFESASAVLSNAHALARLPALSRTQSSFQETQRPTWQKN